ncbi:hypothetical protein ACFPOE_03620 [Caenimonas terrae]|uniref:Uncharacterized protein n=1 Tax=Caenimonas terrae TaxID=696074 RepID=A0ABW0NBQ5_9BURK
MSWLFPSKKRSKAPPASTITGGVQRKSSREAAPATSSAKRRTERAARRELLYAVVREAMVRAGVLSASYKFKVLSLDAEGRQFLIMVDLAHGMGGDAANLAEIEALIAQSAKARHDIVVTAVYWRVNDHVAVGRADVRRRQRAADSHPQADSQPADLHSVPAPIVASAPRGAAYEPIEAEEVEAFKRALVAGSRPAALTPAPGSASAQGPDGKGHHGPRSYTLLTGFEDTEMPDAEQKTQLLSGTQYGELR